MTWPYTAWTRASIDAWTLGYEASTVVGLRIARLALGGPAADREAHLMMTEKIGAAVELQTALLTGALGATALSGTQATLKHYRRKVRANRRRLG